MSTRKQYTKKRIKKSQDELNKKELNFNSDIAGIVLILLGIFMIISIFSSGVTGILGKGMKKLLFFLVGLGSYVVPFLISFIGICYVIKKGKIHFTKRYYGIIIFILNTLLLVQMISIDVYYISGNLSEGITKIWNTESIMHGGIISFLIDIPIYEFFGDIGSYLIFMCVYIISSLMILQITLLDVINYFKKKMKKKKSEIVVDDVKELPKGNSNDKEQQKDSFIKNINKKIKIVDFMKSSEEDQNKKLQQEEDNKEQDNKEEDKEKLKHELEKEIENNQNREEKDYEYPNLELLKDNEALKFNKGDKKELINNAGKLEETLSSFGVEAKVVQVSKGPSVTRFELQPSPGVKVSKIVNLADDIALNLAASGVRIEAPIPGKAAIGIEVPNKELTPVYLKEVIQSKMFNETKDNLSFCLGKDISGNCVVTDITKMPHVLIAGATGSGKSVCINTLIISLLYKYLPEDVKLLMIDPKVVELSVYNGIPHLLIPVVTNPKKAAGALSWAVNEMTKRYKIFAENNVRNIEGYNELFKEGKVENKMPWIVIIIDELADLMMVCPNDVEDYIGRLAQMARAAGMHLVIATQRPSVDVITGVIKANIPSRISFAVSSQIDSRTILDSSGAEKLLGKGDMLFFPVGASKPLRIQGAFISETEVEKVVTFIKNQEKKAHYKEEILEEIDTNVEKKDSDEDELLSEATRIVLDMGQASTSLLQRKLRIGYNRAARIMEQLEERNIISKKEGTKPRRVLISQEDFEKME